MGRSSFNNNDNDDDDKNKPDWKKYIQRERERTQSCELSERSFAYGWVAPCGRSAHVQSGRALWPGPVSGGGASWLYNKLLKLFSTRVKARSLSPLRPPPPRSRALSRALWVARPRAHSLCACGEHNGLPRRRWWRRRCRTRSPSRWACSTPRWARSPRASAFRANSAAASPRCMQ